MACRFDASFQTNYLGHFLLTNMLLDGGVLVPDARIVHVASVMHYAGSIDFSDLNNTGGRVAVRDILVCRFPC